MQLTAPGQYVQFTLTSAANAFDLHYALHQGASGTLSVYVNGTKLSQRALADLGLQLHHDRRHHRQHDPQVLRRRADDVRPDATRPAPPCASRSTRATSAVPYTLDVADFYNVPAAAAQPANTVSVTSDGADPTGVNDSTSAFNQAISAANAAGEAVWIPAGTFLINSHLQITAGTIEGAGDWYSQIKTNELIDNTSAVSGPINLSGFAILGSTVGRHDDSTANAIDGSLGSGWTVNGLWIQDTNVGFWLQYGNSNCTVENSVIESTDADGVNFNGNATNCTVKNNFIRNTGDDSLAIWSYPTADSGITFANNTIVAADAGQRHRRLRRLQQHHLQQRGRRHQRPRQRHRHLQRGVPDPVHPAVRHDQRLRQLPDPGGRLQPELGHPMGAVQFDAYD